MEKRVQTCESPSLTGLETLMDSACGD